MQDFKKLEVWQLAHRLVLDVYRSIDRRMRRFPGLRAQILRASQSISSNIAEGSGSEGAEFVRYLKMSVKSTKELENDLILARDLDVLPQKRLPRPRRKSRPRSQEADRADQNHLG